MIKIYLVPSSLHSRLEIVTKKLFWLLVPHYPSLAERRKTNDVKQHSLRGDDWNLSPHRWSFGRSVLRARQARLCSAFGSLLDSIVNSWRRSALVRNFERDCAGRPSLSYSFFSRLIIYPRPTHSWPLSNQSLADSVNSEWRSILVYSCCSSISTRANRTSCVVEKPRGKRSLFVRCDATALRIDWWWRSIVCVLCRAVGLVLSSSLMRKTGR